MSHATVGDLELYYETFGDPADQPVLLIAGLGAQCLSWPTGFCEALADRYLYVIRFDNRDIGLSTKLDHMPFSLGEFSEARAADPSVQPPYRLTDMADDAAGLLDALGIESAHIAGMSLGGMLAQLVAIRHPARVRTLTSVMSTTGNRDYGQPEPDALAALLWPAPGSREEAVERSLDQRKIWGSPDYIDEEQLRVYFGELWDRDHHPNASARQYGALFSAASREDALRELDVPTLVIHGDKDTLVTPSGGEHTAELINGAELMMLEGLGHDLPSAYWPQIVEAMLALVMRASR